MLYKCNILALVGGGHNPKFSPNKVVLWDDHATKPIGELIFKHLVCAVKLKTDRIVIVLEHKIFIYNFSTLKLLNHIDTCSNPKGLCSMNTDSKKTIIACPGKKLGSVFIMYNSEKQVL
jgi:hypothetical protein